MDTEGKVGITETIESIKKATGGLSKAIQTNMKSAVSSAIQGEGSTANLRRLVEAQGQSWSNAKQKIDQYTNGIISMSTYSGSDAKDALIELEKKGVRFNDALRMQNTLANVAAGSNAKITDVAAALGDAYNGNTNSLKKMGIYTDQDIKKSKNFADIQANLNQKFGSSAATQLNTYSGIMKQFHNSLDSLKESIGSYILPYLTKGAKLLDTFVQKLNSLNPGIKNTIAAVGGITVVAIKVASSFLKIKNTLKDFQPVIESIGRKILNINPVFAVVAAAIAVFSLAYSKNWFGIRDKTKQVINFIKPYIVNGFSAIVNWVKVNWPKIQTTFQAVFVQLQGIYNKVLKPVLNFMMSEFGVVVNWVKANWPLIQSTITIVMNTASSIIKTVLATINSIIRTVLTGIATFWQAHGQTIMKVVSSAFNIIKVIVDTTIHNILNIITLVMQIINGNWSGAWNTLKNIVSSSLNAVISIVRSIISGIGSVFGDLARTAASWGINMINGFIGGIRSMAGKAADAAHGVVKSVANFLGFHSPSKKGEGQNIVNWGSNMIKGFMDGINKQIPELDSLMNTAIKAPKLNSSLKLAYAGVGSSTGSSVGSAVINFNGNYSFRDKKDIDYMLNQAALVTQRRRG
ncbi:hypothetical protein SAMN02745134_02957 [Clostridium acidisoli DSM 12555]|uniref:Phage-related protein n=1 Tax=Clostridium acidisoli DSM 12555 TaxID=1121291 RepID=A0A1W1XSF0_9CLOT|nr:hypothetical protein [Clostridium acidisoli]SMC26817.1 hypothetical protein SAMN02745134_02957 [Clostridium acidisoli DSM 12555]